MRVIDLYRVSSSMAGTFGVLMKDSIPFCLTVELPWRNNERGISCIPPGQYRCVPLEHGSFGKSYLLQDVPDRSEIMIHPANLASQLRGCIAPGTSFDKLKNQDGVHGSRKALDELVGLTQFEEFELYIWGPVL